ncbi:hypothetical protein BWI17_18250 [Betaproteobacteria bacterium GR16-43]|nr:hypothetical protein BWI17_18250 [Betaproteobacteria bacterium GR16-43]
MLEMSFEGWFQCRLATDPDPSSEKRGISGWTFALPGEPDLDRIIRLQPAGTTLRLGSPEVGVKVVSVAVDGVNAAGHALIGSGVEFLDSAIFLGENGAVAKAGDEPVFPFHLRVSKAGLSLERSMMDPATGKPLINLSSGQKARMDLVPRAGVNDVVQYREARRAQLAQAEAAETDPKRKFGLSKRLKSFAPVSEKNVLMWGPVPAFIFVQYDYQMTTPAGVVIDPTGALGAIDTQAPWNAQFFLGCWDADALCGFASGRLTTA